MQKELHKDPFERGLCSHVEPSTTAVCHLIKKHLERQHTVVRADYEERGSVLMVLMIHLWCASGGVMTDCE